MGGMPQFTVELARKTRTALEEWDTELLFKAANALFDGHETLLSALYAAANAGPMLVPPPGRRLLRRARM